MSQQLTDNENPMTMENIKNQICNLSQEDYQSLVDWVIGAERLRREAAPAVEAGQADVVRDLREQGVVEAPADPVDPADPGAYPLWVDPGTTHSRMYLLGDRVQHRGRVWESGVDMLNSWEPGSAHTVWRDITDEIAVPEDPETDTPAVPESPVEHEGPEDPALSEWQAGVAYTVGDQLTYQGGTYRVLQAHTSAAHWTPDAVASLYTSV